MKSLFFVCALVLSLSVGAQTVAPPAIAARSYLLLDLASGQVLAQKDADTSVEPASLTKLMTAYLVFDALRTRKLTLTQKLPVSVRAWKMQGSRMFIDPKTGPGRGPDQGNDRAVGQRCDGAAGRGCRRDARAVRQADE